MNAFDAEDREVLALGAIYFVAIIGAGSTVGLAFGLAVRVFRLVAGL